MVDVLQLAGEIAKHRPSWHPLDWLAYVVEVGDLLASEQQEVVLALRDLKLRLRPHRRLAFGLVSSLVQD